MAKRSFSLTDRLTTVLLPVWLQPKQYTVIARGDDKTEITISVSILERNQIVWTPLRHGRTALIILVKILPNRREDVQVTILVPPDRVDGPNKIKFYRIICYAATAARHEGKL